MNFPFAFTIRHASPQALRRIGMGILATAVLLPAFTALSAFAQVSNVNGITRPSPSPDVPGIPIIGSRQQQDPILHRMMEHMALKRDNARQKQIVADSARLLKLAKQLNADVAKSDVNTLSIPVVKDAAEIEKLAKTIKERMSNGY